MNRRRRVLLVDDYQDDLDLERLHLVRSASELGVDLEVMLAHTLPEALAVIASDPRPDMVVTDLKLATGTGNTDGWRIRDICRAAFPPIRCYVITGTSPFTAAQAAVCISKNPATLRATLRALISEWAPTPAGE